ncbi:MAG: hypothetical protein ACI37T_03555 [Candidatus Gastranaerophilaceae bacterium]
MSMTEYNKAKEAAKAKIYTLEQWKIDNYFQAKVGQEITEEVYNTMLDCCEPKRLPKAKAEWALQHLRIPVHAGFLMGEPVKVQNTDKTMYLAFAMNDYGKGKHFYFIGISEAEQPLNGVFYFFDCMNAAVNKLFKEEAFESDKEAIAFGSNYEAIVLKYTYEDDEPVTIETLYDPWDNFNDEVE